MYVGLIVVIRTLKNEAHKLSLTSSINNMNDVKVCLVCNSNDAHVYETLTEIADQCSNTNVVNAKMKKTSSASIRAGARFLQNEFSLKHIGYIAEIDHLEVLTVLEKFIEYQETIIALNKREKNNKNVKPTFYQSLFSISEYLEKIIANLIV